MSGEVWGTRSPAGAAPSGDREVAGNFSAVYLLDEPFSVIDPITVIEIQKIIAT
jgi:hypothetical protein